MSDIIKETTFHHININKRFHVNVVTSLYLLPIRTTICIIYKLHVQADPFPLSVENETLPYQYKTSTKHANDCSEAKHVVKMTSCGFYVMLLLGFVSVCFANMDPLSTEILDRIEALEKRGTIIIYC